jgi:hypothetical protein
MCAPPQQPLPSRVLSRPLGRDSRMHVPEDAAMRRGLVDVGALSTIRPGWPVTSGQVHRLTVMSSTQHSCSTILAAPMLVGRLAAIRCE